MLVGEGVRLDEGTSVMLDISFGTNTAHLCVVVSMSARAALLSIMRAGHGHTQHKGLP